MQKRKPNIKLMNSVHTEARITKRSKILSILHDVDSIPFYTNRMIEAIRMAQTDPENADTHLCLVAQLCTITRTKLREDKTMTALTEPLKDIPLKEESKSSKEAKEYYMDPLNHPG